MGEGFAKLDFRCKLLKVLWFGLPDVLVWAVSTSRGASLCEK
jgi:hypothetical protein